jgi:acetyl-CoA carboxylase carboxyl transferase subunit alpha
MDIDSLGTVIDEIIAEPVGGAHNNHGEAAASVKKCLKKHLAELQGLSPEELVEQRYRKFRAMSVFEE